MKTMVVVLCGVSLASAASSVALAQAGAPKTVQLSKVVLDTETNQIMARVKGGTLCVFPSNVKIPKEKKTQNYERFDNLFTTVLKSGGFAVISTSNEMFGGRNGRACS